MPPSLRRRAARPPWPRPRGPPDAPRRCRRRRAGAGPSRARRAASPRADRRLPRGCRPASAARSGAPGGWRPPHPWRGRSRRSRPGRGTSSWRSTRASAALESPPSAARHAAAE
eukprot:scaffold53004_cov45-Phaeocystis_antarctica.AAC.1